jgi:hypothetical protein
VQQLPSMHEALGSIPNSAKQGTKCGMRRLIAKHQNRSSLVSNSGLEMRTLRIGFAAARIITSVGGRPFLGPRPSSPLWLRLLWQAGTGWHEFLVMEWRDLRLHLVRQERWVVGPRMGWNPEGRGRAG